MSEVWEESKIKGTSVFFGFISIYCAFGGVHIFRPDLTHEVEGWALESSYLLTSVCVLVSGIQLSVLNFESNTLYCVTMPWCCAINKSFLTCK